MSIFRNPGANEVNLHILVGGIKPNDLMPAVPTLSGVVTLDVAFWGSGYGSRPVADAGSLTIEYLLTGATGKQRIGVVTGPPMAVPFDTTTLNDDTYVLSCRVLKSTSLSRYPAYCYSAVGQTVIINNSQAPLATGVAKQVPITGNFTHSNIESAGVDFLNWPGAPPYLNPHPLTSDVYPSCNGDIAMRDPHKWFVEPLISARHTLYTMAPRWFTSLKGGGVFAKGYYPEVTAAVETSRSAVVRHYNQDGPRNVGMLDGYTTIIAHSNGRDWIGCDIGGRVFVLDSTGGVRTVVGFKWHDWELMYDYQDLTVPEVTFHDKVDPVPPITKQHMDVINAFHKAFREGGATSPAQVKETLLAQGFSPDVITNLSNHISHPLDVCWDTRNPNILYVSNWGGCTIVRVDLTDEAHPVSSLYAGVQMMPGQVKGYVDGPVASAMFNRPTSIQMAKDGTLYITDMMNSAIRAVTPDGSQVYTAFGGTKAAKVPPMNQINLTNRDQWSAPGTVLVDSATIDYPQCMRLDSKGNIVVVSGCAQTVRYIDLANGTITRLAASYSTSPQPAWNWLEVDWAGTCGPKDDIFFVNAASGGYIPGTFGKLCVYRMAIDGTGLYNMALGNGLLSDGPVMMTQETSGHYPWVIAISRTEARFLTMGYGTIGVSSWRPLQPSEATIHYDNIRYNRGYLIHKSGTVPCFPWGYRPSFSSICGDRGHNWLGVTNFDDLVQQYPDDLSLGQYVQSGMGGSVPRREITGNDLADYIYWIRRSALGGYAVQPAQYQKSPAPTVTVVSASRQGDQITVSWTTSVPTLGLVAWSVGDANYYGYSDFESDYSTTHSITFSATTDPLHYSVLAKDVTGNSSNSPDAIIP